MKTIRLFTVIAIAIMLLGNINMNAQPKSNAAKKQGPALTEDQKAKIKEIRIASYKDVKQLKNQLGELQAKQRTLTTADKPDLEAINANIDEIGKIQTKMMKIKASNLQKVRGLLTDEQKMWFDSKDFRNNERNKMKMHRKGEFNHPQRTERS